MPAYRYFCDHPLKNKKEVRLEGLEFQHLGRVMRGKVGDVVDLVNGLGELAQGEILEIDRKGVTLRVSDLFFEKKPKQRLILAQASPKMNRLEFILEKGTELGMTELWLFPGVHSEKKKFTNNQLDRMRHITIAAMKQSGRLYLPNIVLMPTLEEWKELSLPAYFGDISGEAPHLADVYERESALIFIGPEAGFSNEEEATLKDLGAMGVKLHKNILRADTAAIAALAILSHKS